MPIKKASANVSIKSILDGTRTVRYKQCVAVLQGPFYRVLGQRLRNERREARLTQIKLANNVGLSRSSIANIESGRQPVYVHALVSIAGQLGVSLNDLVPSKQVPDDQRIECELKKLGAQQRNWVVRILKSPTDQEGEENGTEVRVVQKARHGIAAARTSKKATGPHRKAGDLVKRGDKESAFLG
jgi:transcriptional regulator with XRE-family HTH domain